MDAIEIGGWFGCRCVFLFFYIMRRLKDTLWRIDAISTYVWGERFTHWRTSSLNFLYLISLTRTISFCIFMVSFWSEKVGSGQKFLSKLWFLYFWIEKKWQNGQKKWANGQFLVSFEKPANPHGWAICKGFWSVSQFFSFLMW